jgi:DNA-binding transcriptional regulator YdaS (Cro superfamily)
MAKQQIEMAVKAAGSKAKLARALGITRSAISQWNRIPVNRVVEVESITGIPRQELRPDVFNRGHA